MFALNCLAAEPLASAATTGSLIGLPQQYAETDFFIVFFLASHNLPAMIFPIACALALSGGQKIFQVLYL